MCHPPTKRTVLQPRVATGTVWLAAVAAAVFAAELRGPPRPSCGCAAKSRRPGRSSAWATWPRSSPPIPAKSETLAAIELFPAPTGGEQRFLRLRELQDLLTARGLNLSEHTLSGASQIAVQSGVAGRPHGQQSAHPGQSAAHPPPLVRSARPLPQRKRPGRPAVEVRPRAGATRKPSCWPIRSRRSRWPAAVRPGPGRSNSRSPSTRRKGRRGLPSRPRSASRPRSWW